MNEDERFEINAKIQEYCQYWVQILNLQKWIIVARLTDNIKEKMSYDVESGTATIPVITEDTWKKYNPMLPYDMEASVVRNLLRLTLESKKATLSINHIARVLVQFKKAIALKEE